MVNNGENELTTGSEQSGATQAVRGVGSRIAPAVALLMLGDSVYAADAQPVPEPTSFSLLAAGAAVGGVVAYIRSKRRK